jgi:hypothetical protein
VITNIPSENEYKLLANSCLVQAFDIIFETDRAIRNHPNKGMEERVWEYVRDKLNTAVVLIHQANEAFMKASICQTSPFLLIEEKRTEWSTLPHQKDKPFDNFYTLQSEALLYTFFATAKATYHESLQEHINEIRKVRNQIVHGISKQNLNPKSLLINILDTYTYFRGKDIWWDEMRNFHLDHPLNEGMDYESFETVLFVERLDYTWNTIGKAELAKHFSVDIKNRKYFCPICLPIDKSLLNKFDYKLSFLVPNDPKATKIICINCSTSADIKRIDCPLDKCKGNVIWEDYICLTCGEDVSFELYQKRQMISTLVSSLYEIAKDRNA